MPNARSSGHGSQPDRQGLYNGGFEAAKKLYNKYDMELIGWWVYGQESLA